MDPPADDVNDNVSGSDDDERAHLLIRRGRTWSEVERDASSSAEQIAESWSGGAVDDCGKGAATDDGTAAKDTILRTSAPPPSSRPTTTPRPPTSWTSSTSGRRPPLPPNHRPVDPLPSGGGSRKSRSSNNGDDDADDNLDTWMDDDDRHSLTLSPCCIDRLSRRKKYILLINLTFITFGLFVLVMYANELVGATTTASTSTATEQNRAQYDVDEESSSSSSNNNDGRMEGHPNDEEGTTTKQREKLRRKKEGNNYIGFHEPSMENIYGSNHHHKPIGVGYAVRPIGGLHPVYHYYANNHVDIHNVAEDDGIDYYDHETTSTIIIDHEESPYVDIRLDISIEQRNVERKVWKEKLDDIRRIYGYWNFTDTYYCSSNNNNDSDDDDDERPTVDWLTVKTKTTTSSTTTTTKSYDPLLGEIDPIDFPNNVWQTDDVYISNFIHEGRALIHRVRNAIYDELGWEEEDDGNRGGGIQLLPDNVADATTTTTVGGTRDAIVSWMYNTSYHALSKKLLNAMITNDHFFITLGGHSAAAGHGNNFHQSYMMEIQHVMAPIFDRLGMILVSANRAQGGMGTIQTALAGGSIYGDADFVLWDSSMTEKDDRAKDLFMRQMLLAGKRVPILFDLGNAAPVMKGLHDEVGAHVGGIYDTTTHLLPKFRNTVIDFQEKKYNAKCWTDRIDVTPEHTQNTKYGGQASWHPGNWVHQSTARKISLLFLHAFDEAFNIWEKAASVDGNPLDGKYWHLQDEEDVIRKALQSANATSTKCGQLFTLIPRICTIPMRGATEWTPRNDPYHTSIRSLIKPSSISGYTPDTIDMEELAYRGRDPHIPTQRVPQGEIDVATVARSVPPRRKEDANSKRRRLFFSLSSSSSSSSSSSIANLRRLWTKEGITHQPIFNSHIDGFSMDPPTNSTQQRLLQNNITSILPGEGWSVVGHPSGFCDGTSNSVCYRHKTFDCLMSGHNDGRGVLKGDALSGWLVLQLKDVTEGIFMARIEPWHDYYSNKRTEGWTEVNNGITNGSGGGNRRQIKKTPPPLPPEFRFEVAVNGVVISSGNETEALGPSKCSSPGYNLKICVLWNDEDWAKEKRNEDIEFAIRILGPTGAAGRTANLGISHIYYA